MQWILSSSSSDTVHEYHLIESGDVKLVLKYNPTQQSARIFYEDKQRLVFIERTGFWNNNIIFKNEYGIGLGKVTYEKWDSHHSGIIELEGKRYHHTISDSKIPELLIYENKIAFPLMTCELNPALKNTEKSKLNFRNNDEEYTGLMIGLCWKILMTNSIKNMPVLKADYNISLA